MSLPQLNIKNIFFKQNLLHLVLSLKVEGKDQTLNFGYGNNPYFWADYDPPSDSTGIEQIVYPNFTNENKIEWINDDTRNLFRLYDITNKQYDQDGVLVGGDLVWAKYNETVQA